MKKKLNSYYQCAMIIEVHHLQCFVFTNAPLIVLYYNPTKLILSFNIFKINLNSTSNIWRIDTIYKKDIMVHQKQVILLGENPTLFSFFWWSILIAIFTFISKSVYTSSTIFHFETFFAILKFLGHKKTIFFIYK